MRTYPEEDRKTPVTVSLPPGVVRRLDEEAYSARASRSEVMRRILEDWINVVDNNTHKRGKK